MSMTIFETGYHNNCCFKDKKRHIFTELLMCALSLKQMLTHIFDNSKNTATKRLTCAAVEVVTPVTIMQL